MTGDPTRDDHATEHHFIGGEDNDYVAAQQAKAEKGIVLDVDKDAKTVRVSGLTLMDRALIEVGSERSAIKHCQRVYDVDRDTAFLLVRAVRDGQEVTDA